MGNTLRFTSNVLAYEDSDITSNPLKKNVDWTRSVTVSVQNPQQFSYVIQPNASMSVFSGLRTTAIDNTTEFQLTISPLSYDRYRFTWDGTGTAPAFRTDRGLTPNGKTYTLVVNINETVSFSSGTTGDFSSVVTGDVLFIPGVSTGDTSGPFNVLNEGIWTVLSKDGTNTTLQLSRPTGVSFSGYGQVVTATSNSNFMAYSVAGVQPGDTVNISAGFAAPVLSTFTVDAVTPSWFEILTTTYLPVAQTAVPGASGMLFYSNAKRFVKVESDQNCALQLNGDSNNSCLLAPWYVGESCFPGEFIKTGPTWSLTVVNTSAVAANVLVITAE